MNIKKRKMKNEIFIKGVRSTHTRVAQGEALGIENIPKIEPWKGDTDVIINFELIFATTEKIKP